MASNEPKVSQGIVSHADPYLNTSYISTLHFGRILSLRKGPSGRNVLIGNHTCLPLKQRNQNKNGKWKVIKNSSSVVIIYDSKGSVMVCSHAEDAAALNESVHRL